MVKVLLTMILAISITSDLSASQKVSSELRAALDEYESSTPIGLEEIPEVEGIYVESTYDPSKSTTAFAVVGISTYKGVTNLSENVVLPEWVTEDEDLRALAGRRIWDGQMDGRGIGVGDEPAYLHDGTLNFELKHQSDRFNTRVSVKRDGDELIILFSEKSWFKDKPIQVLRFRKI